MNWQEGLAVVVAAGCGAWVLWTTLRPFVRKVAGTCGACPGCSPTAASAAPVRGAELLQIAPPEPQ